MRTCRHCLPTSMYMTVQPTFDLAIVTLLDASLFAHTLTSAGDPCWNCTLRPGIGTEIRPSWDKRDKHTCRLIAFKCQSQNFKWSKATSHLCTVDRKFYYIVQGDVDPTPVFTSIERNRQSMRRELRYFFFPIYRGHEREAWGSTLC